MKDLPLEEEKRATEKALCEKCFGFTEVDIIRVRNIILHISDKCHSCGIKRVLYSVRGRLP